MVHESKAKRTKRLSESSMSEWTRSDFEFMGFYKLKALALNGDPLDSGCRTEVWSQSGLKVINSHKINLDEEDGILYLVCTECKNATFLHERDKPNYVQDKRENNQRRFRSL